MNCEKVTFAGELKRMRSTAHLYQPQDHRAYQHSGFCRKGGNPDRFDCLYAEHLDPTGRVGGDRVRPPEVLHKQKKTAGCRPGIV